MQRILMSVLCGAVAACWVMTAAGQQTPANPSPASAERKPSAHASQEPSAGSSPAVALEFLGSYSAPEAVAETETGHTSARPPAATTDQRLAEIDAGHSITFHDDAERRRWLVDSLAAGSHSAAEWFETGGVALAEARANSKRLSETDPDGLWARQLEAAAVEGRYPLLAALVLRERRGEQPATGERGHAGASAKPSNVGPTEIPSLAEAEALPDSPRAFYLRARAAIAASEVAYGHAAADPRFDARLIALEALEAEQADDEAAAEREYVAGLAKYPESEALHAGLGHLYRERQEFQKSRSELEAALGLDPADAVAAFELGDVDRRLGHPEQALALLDRAVELDSGLLVARWSRARAYMALGKRDQALADFEAAAPADSTGELQYELARLYDQMGRAALAAEARARSQNQRRAIDKRKNPTMNEEH